MGVALAEAVLAAGDVPVVVSGPVNRQYPNGTVIYRVQTTDEMLAVCLEQFPSCAGVIGAAAPCDYKPLRFSQQKLSKELNGTLHFEFAETPDILATLGRQKRSEQWSVGFALETQNGKENALEKSRRKNCDFIVLNHPSAIDDENSAVQIFDQRGTLRQEVQGTKREIADVIIKMTNAIPLMK
jgi:phosphopantothenoylcysteine decarboxylase/phosphopantothenate--cysteine ligase